MMIAPFFASGSRDTENSVQGADEVFPGQVVRDQADEYADRKGLRHGVGDREIEDTCQRETQWA